MRYINSVLTGLIIMAVFVQSSQGQGNAEAARYSREGVEASKAKDWNRAVENFRKAVEAEPQDKKNSDNLAIALVHRATAALQEKNSDAALNDLNEALKLKPDDLGTRRSRAYAYLLKGDWNNALQDYDVVVRGMKNDPEPRERRAYVEMQLKDYDRALNDYSEAIKLKPDETRYYQLRGYILQLKGDFKGALEDVNKVLQAEPNNADAQQRKRFLESKLHGPATPPPLPAGPIANPNAPPPQTGQTAPSNQVQPMPSTAKTPAP
jgi:tetratricopeptide (TPR) repeat protein